MVLPAFLVSGVSQATPCWYTTKGVGLWVRTRLDFLFSVNEVVDGKRDGLLRVVNAPRLGPRVRPHRREGRPGAGAPLHP